MMGHTPQANPATRPGNEHAGVCLACSEGDHEQALVNEHCLCPCHCAQPAEREVAA